MELMRGWGGGNRKHRAGKEFVVERSQAESRGWRTEGDLLQGIKIMTTAMIVIVVMMEAQLCAAALSCNSIAEHSQ